MRGTSRILSKRAGFWWLWRYAMFSRLVIAISDTFGVRESEQAFPLNSCMLQKRVTSTSQSLDRLARYATRTRHRPRRMPTRADPHQPAPKDIYPVFLFSSRSPAIKEMNSKLPKYHKNMNCGGKHGDKLSGFSRDSGLLRS